MKHLFWNGEGETVAADTVEEASHYYDCELGDEAAPTNDWKLIPDETNFTVREAGENGETLTKKAKEWAAECSSTTVVATTYM